MFLFLKFQSINKLPRYEFFKNLIFNFNFLILCADRWTNKCETG
jgi:hypothetical protein